LAEKQHICARMVEIIEGAGMSVAKWEQDAAEKEVKVSGGYLRKAAKNNTNIGIDLVDYFLEQFPDVNVEWLITGRGLRRNTDKKVQPQQNSSEADKANLNLALQNNNTLLATLQHWQKVVDARNEEIYKLKLKLQLKTGVGKDRKG
jgi:hypothetical protein